MRPRMLSFGVVFVLGTAAPAWSNDEAPVDPTSQAESSEAPAPEAAGTPAAEDLEAMLDASLPASIDVEAATAEMQGGDALEEEPEPAPVPAAPAPAPEPRGVQLGQLGYDAQGRPGRIHVVTQGDTLWDISDAYLGTPWVWPSVWTDNEDIQNPHLIRPGDRIWITPNEMRRISEEEAEALLAGTPAEEELPAAFDDAPAFEMPGSAPAPTYRYSQSGTMGFITFEEYQGLTEILDSEETKVWLSDQDHVIIGVAQGETEVGARWDIVRTGKRVVDPETDKVMGFATEQLGWLEITEVDDETASGFIRQSSSEIRRGDHVLPRTPPPLEISLAPTPDVEGMVLHTPRKRLQMGSTDVVFLNRGTTHGVEVGSPLEIFRSMGSATDSVRGDERRLPDHVIAKLLVIETADDTSVAVITHTTEEINRGDRFRGAADPNP